MCKGYFFMRSHSGLGLLVAFLVLGFLGSPLNAQTNESPKPGESLTSAEFTLTSLSTDLVERLTRRIEQLESLRAKSNAQEQELAQLHSTLESLLTTLGETSKSRDEFKQKYESEKQAVDDVKRTVKEETESLRKQRDEAMLWGGLVASIGLPVGGFAGTAIATRDVGTASMVAIGAIGLEAVIFGGLKLYEYAKSLDEAKTKK